MFSIGIFLVLVRTSIKCIKNPQRQENVQSITKQKSETGLVATANTTVQEDNETEEETKKINQTLEESRQLTQQYNASRNQTQQILGKHRFLNTGLNTGQILKESQQLTQQYEARRDKTLKILKEHNHDSD